MLCPATKFLNILRLTCKSDKLSGSYSKDWSNIQTLSKNSAWYVGAGVCRDVLCYASGGLIAILTDFEA